MILGNGGVDGGVRGREVALRGDEIRAATRQVSGTTGIRDRR
jgi:hypothetical protein